MADDVEQCRAALKRCPPSHSDQSESLNNLAISLGDRFMQQVFCLTLMNASSSIEGHYSFVPPVILIDHTFSTISPLAFETNSGSGAFHPDLDECIELHQVALLLHPPGHSDRSCSLDNLAVSLRDRFTQQGVPSDLDESNKSHWAALLLHPPALETDSGRGVSHMTLMSASSSMGLHCSFVPPAILFDHTLSTILPSALETNSGKQGVRSDLDESLHWAVLLLRPPPGHSYRSQSLNNLAISLQDRFMQRGMPSDIDETFSLLLQLPHISYAVSRADLTAAKSWATTVEVEDHGSALLAYQAALKFLDQHVTLLSSSLRHFDVCSSRCAVELVEQGRAVFWTQLARLSSPFDELSLPGDIGGALAQEFKQLSFRLRSAFDQSTEEQSPEIQQLTMQWNNVVSRIRMLPNLSRFLLPPLFSDLQMATKEGPVIIVDASQYGCDALIVLRDQNPVHVPIDVTRTEVSELCSDFHSVAEQFGSSRYQNKLAGVLHKLWHDIVDSVVQAHGVSDVRPAGPYEREEDNLSQIYNPSYTPTLATLVRNPDREKELRCVAPELAAIAQRLAPIVSSFTSLEDGDATVQGVLDALNHNQWLHLACHGTPNRQRPFESSFAMRDGPLMIKDIIRSNWQNPEFAFLSACHTTVGDEKSPDESIHLAVAMQFSGFRSVIGSMWSVDDKVARQVVSAFYDRLVDDSGRLDCTRAAVALHKAVKNLRRNNIPLEQQIVFVHIGVWFEARFIILLQFL
ncbi:CHAT domain-containing protein [Suillus subaureus]|uniref:CHAT domain-containing protein n=1 Tax=Suillus subaureus TaxID=48587 RepID=A0A9P7JHD2_9AGAM|nr:CHAT domain-containing protein [Suillus subaureus]KAG1822523.1 CHAT domain-containing protein [Suillus subaureus]